ncbi:hypothetical protein ACFVUS_26470 [Nocardia sp. NPDC058058]|uniref:hypothetical protein n=1 Tax=Nocardia sp. NPDC058058 TaxID=3346317 RepID=UPI0036DF67EB
MSDNISRTARLRQLLRRGSEGSTAIEQAAGADPVPAAPEPVGEKAPPKRVCPRLPAWVFTLSGSDMQKMLDYSGVGNANRAVRREVPVADTIPPALTVTDYLAHRQRSVAIRLIMDCAEQHKPGSVLEFVRRCDADELRRVWAGTVGAEALIATATAGPIPVLALLAAELLDRAHRWQDLGELGRAAESVGYRANQLFREYVHADEIDARKAAWGQDAKVPHQQRI